MSEILIPSLYLLSGVCAYASFTHLCAGLRHPFDRTQIVFAGLSLMVLLYALSDSLALRAETVGEFVVALKWNLAFITLLYASLLGFVTLYTGIRPLPLLVATSLLLVVLLWVDYIQPYSLQYVHISGLRRVRMPWGEVITLAEGQNGAWFYVSIMEVLAIFGYVFYALGSAYRRSRSRYALGMICAVFVFVIGLVQSALVRLAFIDFPHLAPYAFLGMAIMMSVILNSESQQRLRTSENRFRSLVEQSPFSIQLLAPDGRALLANAAWEKMWGRKAQAVAGYNILEDQLLIEKGVMPYIRRGLKGKATEIPPMVYNPANGSMASDPSCERWVRAYIYPVKNDKGVIQELIQVQEDITERKKAEAAEKKSEEMIWRQANYDLLTELPNRRMVQDRLKEEIKKSHRDGKSLALLIIDLDRFKEVNDSLGHGVGDALLQEAAQRMAGCVREADTVGRLGGDEFTVILGDVDDIIAVERIANSLLDKLAAPYRLGGEIVHASASMGITLYPEDATDFASLLQYADQAMYAAKREGRNRFHYYTTAMQEAANVRMRLINDLHIALTDQQFTVHYQAIMELSTNAIHKAEALIRWQHPKLGWVSPDDFIPVAEDTGLIVKIGNWVFRQAAAQVARWRAAYDAEFQVSINASPLQFRHDSVNLTEWRNRLEELGLPGQSIVIEITEGLLMEAKEKISRQLLASRDCGMQIALDDFGTGYSSLSYLKKFDIDYLKIDQSFISNLAADPNDLALCEAIIVMAHKLGIKVVAEGVETSDQCELLKQIGCDYGQGYLFSKALPADEFEKLLMAGIGHKAVGRNLRTGSAEC